MASRSWGRSAFFGYLLVRPSDVYSPKARSLRTRPMVVSFPVKMEFSLRDSVRAVISFPDNRGQVALIEVPGFDCLDLVAVAFQATDVAAAQAGAGAKIVMMPFSSVLPANSKTNRTSRLQNDHVLLFLAGEEYRKRHHDDPSHRRRPEPPRHPWPETRPLRDPGNRQTWNLDEGDLTTIIWATSTDDGPDAITEAEIPFLDGKPKRPSAGSARIWLLGGDIRGVRQSGTPETLTCRILRGHRPLPEDRCHADRPLPAIRRP